MSIQKDDASSAHNIFSFQLISDIHLEMRQDHPFPRFPVPPRRAPILALLGDIGAGWPIDCPTKEEVEHHQKSCYYHLLQFLEACCQRFDLVLYVLGNHEGYGASYDKALSILTEFEEKMGREKFAVLNRSFVDIPFSLLSASSISPQGGTTVQQDSSATTQRANAATNVSSLSDRSSITTLPSDAISTIRVLGCTLWTHIPPERRKMVASCLNDLRGAIQDFNPERFEEEFQKNISWISENVKKARQFGKVVVVMTHHAPILDGTYPPSATAFTLALGINGTALVQAEEEIQKSYEEVATAGKGKLNTVRKGKKKLTRYFYDDSSDEEDYEEELKRGRKREENTQEECSKNIAVDVGWEKNTSCYFNNCRTPNVAMWAYGHTHWNMDTRKAGIHLVTNQVGYPRDPNLSESANPGFDPYDEEKVFFVKIFLSSATNPAMKTEGPEKEKESNRIVDIHKKVHLPPASTSASSSPKFVTGTETTFTVERKKKQQVEEKREGKESKKGGCTTN